MLALLRGTAWLPLSGAPAPDPNFTPGSGGSRIGRGPWETRAFVVDSVPHYPNKIEQFTRGGEVVRQNLRARLHGDAPWRRELRYRLVRGGG